MPKAKTDNAEHGQAKKIQETKSKGNGSQGSMHQHNNAHSLGATAYGAGSQEDIYDAIIVGGGPAGSSCAAFLGKAGKRVLLLDKNEWPRDKTCGDALSGKTIGILRDLGLVQEVENSDHGAVAGLTFSSPDGKIASIIFGGKDGEISKGYVCRRMVFDNLLFQNAKKYSEAIEGAEAAEVIFRDGKAAGVRAKMKDGSGKEFFGKLIIGADGVNSAVAKGIRDVEIDPDHTCIAYRAYYSGIKGMNGTIEIHFVKSIMPGYFWIFPLENGLANVGVGMVMQDMKKKKSDLKRLMVEATESNPLFKDRFKDAKLVSEIKAWSLPFGSKKRKIHADNVMLAGDAAGLVDPFSGEGMGNAMLSGKMCAKTAAEALDAGDTSEAFLSRYAAKLWEAVEGELSRSYAMQKVGRNEWLLNFVINRAAKSEKAREAIAETFTNEEAKKGYSSPFFYLKLLFS